MKIIKEHVCVNCFGNMYQTDCVCVYQKHKTIELEFQWCECCNRRYDQPADTKFNKEQYKTIK